ncbi:MAG: murein hydrolase effector protein LrgB [Bacillus thermozeamaize]|uniref:Murein hydrolase effector protein LrgB n=1 Tax=Bacillus thermozeamaize TaxID=230954 RepID=A0A1Y3PTR3_9BACI|nr:MAG: murein hydrolase effector protein LrgB [Bacillus thermozeamaize]
MEPWNNPLFGVSLTVGLYTAMSLLNRRWKWVNPLFFSAGLIILILLVTGIDHEAYQAGGQLVSFFLGPATVALAVPFVKQMHAFRKHRLGILTGVIAGSVLGILSAGGIAWLCGGQMEVILSMIPKSVTSPISAELSRELGGIPGLTVVVTVLAGLLGNLFGYSLLKKMNIDDPVARGVAMGTAAHGIGTARALQESPVDGGMSSFAMALAGVVTSILVIPLYGWLGP